MQRFIDKIIYKIYAVAASAAKLLQSCPNLFDPINGIPSGSSVPVILHARTLEWVAISFSRKYMNTHNFSMVLRDPRLI